MEWGGVWMVLLARERKVIGGRSEEGGGRLFVRKEGMMGGPNTPN